MPERPPREWFNGCVASVTQHGGARNPRAVCGAMWAKKSDAEKRAIIEATERLVSGGAHGPKLSAAEFHQIAVDLKIRKPPRRTRAERRRGA